MSKSTGKAKPGFVFQNFVLSLDSEVISHSNKPLFEVIQPVLKQQPSGVIYSPLRNSSLLSDIKGPWFCDLTEGFYVVDV